MLAWLGTILFLLLVGCERTSDQVEVSFRPAPSVNRAAPSNWNGHDCYFLSVSASDIPTSSESLSCMGVGQTTQLISVSALFQIGILWRVPTGFQRTFRFFGVRTGGSCNGKSIEELVEEETPEIRLLGEQTVDQLFQPQSLVLKNRYSIIEPDRVAACAGGGNSAILLAHHAEGLLEADFSSVTPFSANIPDDNAILGNPPLTLEDRDADPLEVCAGIQAAAGRPYPQVLLHYRLPPGAKTGDTLTLTLSAWGGVRSLGCLLPTGSGTGYSFSLRRLAEPSPGSWESPISVGTPSNALLATPVGTSKNYTLDMAAHPGGPDGNLVLFAIRGDASGVGSQALPVPRLEIANVQVTYTPQ